MSSMQASHDELLDLVAVYALGALGAEEARIASMHLAVCTECRAEYDALRPAADAVAYAADDRLDLVDCPRIKREIMRAIRPPQRSAIFVASTVAALAAALVFAFIAVSAERKAAETDRTIAALVGPGARQYDVSAGEIVKSGDHIYLVMAKLAPLPAGRVYQAWTLAPGAKTMAPNVTFSPNSQGFVLVTLTEAAQNVGVVAVSVEPSGGSQAPTTKPLFVRPLT
ncbi:MAG: anti-sigma factor [Candidatus Eremiobacteraeota bacterium]|nr:anti-sigma factor [Candidatus Eremiobacteraeota bacterium]